MANRKTKPLRKVSNRKIARNILKAKNGSNKIQNAWYDLQVKKYGFREYIALRISKKKRSFAM